MQTAPDIAPIPRHVAVIMDGNGRWATSRGLPRVEGHLKGADTVRDVTQTARRLGVQRLTLYAFSEQNWERPQLEVSALMDLLRRYLLDERREILDNGIRLSAIGALDKLPLVVRAPLEELRNASAHNTGMELCLALSYGGREELVRAVRELAGKVRSGSMRPEDLDEDAITAELATPDVDLLIRTSGEQRISNFLLWQCAYAELYFVDKMWPEFTNEDFVTALRAYAARDRRFGRVA